MIGLHESSKALLGQAIGREMNSTKFRKNGLRTVIGAVALVVSACGGAADVQPSAIPAPPTADSPADGPAEFDAAGYFSGKTITLIVPYGAGGGTDVLARLMAANVGKHIPGNPNVQVVNITGGGGVVGANEFDLTEADGLTWLLTSSPVVFNALIGNENVKYDFREWEVLAALQTAGMYVTVPGTGFDPNNLASIKDATFFGGATSYVSAPTTVYYLLDKLGADVQFLSGFDGTGAIRLAFDQGELSLFNPPTSQFLGEEMQAQIQAGDIIPVVNPGLLEDGQLVRPRRIPDVPSAQELWEAVYGPAGTSLFEWEVFRGLHAVAYGLQKGLFAPAGTPPEVLEALRSGFEGLEQDTEFAALLFEATGDEVPSAGAAAQELFELLDVSDAALEAWLEWLAEYGFER